MDFRTDMSPQPDFGDPLPIDSFCPPVILTAFDAGAAILDIYGKVSFQVQYKADKSPLTEADKASNAIIMERLLSLWDIPVLSEESREVAFDTRRHWPRFWLVDPLDGTKEFIRRNGEFTVNIALVAEGVPTYGVVYAPVTGELYFGALGHGACKLRSGKDFDGRDGLERLLSSPEHMDALPRLPLPGALSPTLRVVASRSHSSEATVHFIDEVGRHSRRPVELVSIGSSLKLCLIAEGRADVYPRLAPTMEWDTGAANAIAAASGCRVLNHDTGQPLVYNKPCLTNPFFTAYAAGWPKQLEL